MDRSNARVMWRMLGLARPLAGWMVLAVACGVAGFCCATGIPVLASAAALESRGLAGYVYTQVSDVEEELNGLLTYDRRVDKFAE